MPAACRRRARQEKDREMCNGTGGKNRESGCMTAARSRTDTSTSRTDTHILLSQRLSPSISRDFMLPLLTFAASQRQTR